jgi:hypothetical protein
MKTNPNEPVQPIYDTLRHIVDSNGLTKREYIATMALQGIVTVFSGSTNAERQAKQKGVTVSRLMALYATDIADELIKALNEPQTNNPMTPSPKEKAIEIYSLYDSLFKAPYKSHLQIKQCAIITVNEILEALPIKKLLDAELYDYWVTVKTELENTN